ncbi:3-oxoacyl-[acyl-carrier-protein] synthase [Actinidia chinensis var. chinensis]|uniref:beta-ketoacyl-[acyl-carrier-protein] synthase I n=1 Tax=Actinidia chinensis var. chinensis TaxID=1590841 RepID=A0A2R6R436_ACTCC|nr:3-oxoacyl-[acyl-carrier-protein] synthase [Actinidia chinensis var. chinensis]
MASSSSAVCTWLVAACMSLASDNQNPSMSPRYSSMPRPSSRKQKRRVSNNCTSRGLISANCIRNLMSSFEPCDQYYSSHGFASIFGSRNVPVVTRRQKKMNRATHSVEAMAISGQPAKEVTAKKRPPTKQRRVVVTGMGVETPVGDNPDVFYNNLLEGVSGISEIEAFDCAHFPTKIAGEIKSYSTDGWVAPKLSKRMDKFMLYMLTAGKKAIADGGITEETMQDMMLCGGSDAAVIPIGLGGSWSSSLEDLEHVKKRGANIYAEFLGGSFTCDAYHMTEPYPEGAGVVLCIEKALAQSGVPREDVNYINAHATSTPSGDLKEYEALIRCFGHNPELRVNSTKSMIGHLLGGAGAVEAVATVQAIRTGWVHPNINLEHPEECVDMNVLVGPKKERLDIKVALSNSFGFGGHNSSILFAPYK